MDDSDERPWWLSRDGDAGGPGETGDAADHESNAQDRSAGSTQGWDLTSMLGMLGKGNDITKFFSKPLTK